MKSLLALVLFIPLAPAFAETGPGYAGTDGVATHVLEVDGHVFEVRYSVDADVIAMAVDRELDSVLIGLDNAGGSVMTVDLPHELIRAENNAYAVLVNGVEADYEVAAGDGSSVLSFAVPEFSEEVEIIGTYVIPEFPLGVLTGLAAVVSAMLVISRTGNVFFR